MRNLNVQYTYKGGIFEVGIFPQVAEKYSLGSKRFYDALEK